MTAIVTWLIIIFTIAIYFYPTSTAYCKNKKNKNGIFVINALLGWTLLGWVIAFAWASCDD